MLLSKKKRQVNPPIMTWVDAILRTRIAETNIAGSSMQMEMTKGWASENELLDLLTSKSIRCQGYADEIVIIARGKFESIFFDIMRIYH